MEIEVSENGEEIYNNIVLAVHFFFSILYESAANDVNIY